MSTSFIGIPSVDAIAKNLAATEKQVEQAMRSAIRKTMIWAGNQGRSGIAERLNIRLSATKGRVKVFIRADEGMAKSFFGLNDLPSSRLNPKQTATGATMEGMKGEVKHAFVAKGKSGKKFVFLRKTDARFPITQVGLPINDIGQEVIANEVFPKVEDRFLFEFQREMQWQIQKS